MHFCAWTLMCAHARGGDTSPGTGLACFLSTLFTANITNFYLNVSIPEAGIFSINSIAPLESSIYGLLDRLVNLPLRSFAPLVTRIVQGVFANTIRDLLNTALTTGLSNAPACTGAPLLNPWNGSAPFDFSTSPTMMGISSLLNAWMGAPGVNRLLTCIFGQHSSPSGVVASFDLGPVHLGLSNISLTNLASFHNFTLLAPVSAHMIDSRIWLGYLPREVPTPRCTGSSCALQWARNSTATQSNASSGPLILSLSVDANCGTFAGTINLTVVIGNLDMELDLSLLLQSWGLSNLTMAQLGTPGCFLSQVSSLNMSRFNILLDELDISVNIGLTNNPAVMLHLNGTNFTANVVKLIQHALLPSFAASFQASTAYALFAAPYQCTHTPIPTPAPSSGAFPTWLAVLGGVALFLATLLCFYGWYAKRWCFRSGQLPRSNQRSWAVPQSSSINSPSRTAGKTNTYEQNEPSLTSDEHIDTGSDDDAEKAPRVDWHESLLFAPAIPVAVRKLMPVVLVMNIGLYLAAHLCIGAAPGLMLTIGGQIWDLGPIFNFSLGNSVHDMWFAGVYLMALLVATLSGAWVYIKILMMLACWVLPRQLLSENMRENVLMFLEYVMQRAGAHVSRNEGWMLRHMLRALMFF
jgi:hypothetical protein